MKSRPTVQKISCVICAYNEAERLPYVLAVLKGHPAVDEVIVVDDGSTDGTARVVEESGFAKLVRHSENRGKSAALATGIRAAEHDTLLLLDADLQGLTAKNVSDLVKPVKAGKADVALSLHRNSSPLCHLIGFNYISGDRVFAKSMIEPYLDEIERLTRYGIEVFMNGLIIAKKLTIASVLWDNVRNPDKVEKSGDLVNGISNQLSMVSDILEVAPIHEVVHQHLRFMEQTTKKPRRRFFRSED